jgi:hypothetical protein
MPKLFILPLSNSSREIFLYASKPLSSKPLHPVLAKGLKEWNSWSNAKEGTLKRRVFKGGNTLLNKIHPYETLLMRIPQPPLLLPLKIVSPLPRKAIMEQLQILASRETLHTRNLYGAIALLPLSASFIVRLARFNLFRSSLVLIYH